MVHTFFEIKMELFAGEWLQDSLSLWFVLINFPKYSQNLLKGYEIMSNRITFQSNQALYPLTFGNKLIHKSTTEKYFHLYADVFVNLFSYQYTWNTG